MAKVEFKMKFGGYGKGVSKAGNNFYTIKLIEEIDNYERTRKELALNTFFPESLPDDISSYDLYDDVVVVLEVSGNGQRPRFITMSPYKGGGEL